jgi:small ligand-binding sensory domain FIST
MTAYRTAHAAGQHWSDVTRACLAQLGEVPAADGARLGFVYVTDHLATHLAEIVDHLRLMTGIADWVGTVGIGILAHGPGGSNLPPAEYFDEPAMALMVGDFPADALRILEPGGGSLEGRHGDWIAAHHPSLALVHGDPRSQHLPRLLETLATTASAFLVGGLSSSRSSFPQVAQSVGDGGTSGVMFAAEVAVATGLSQGCSPIGPHHTITECDQNIVMAIDDRPALEVFKSEIGDVLARNLNRVAGFIFAALPLPGSDTGDYLVRNITGIDPKRGWIAIGDLVETGQQIMFTRRDRESAEADLGRMIDRLKQRIDRPVKGGIYVSCVARGINLFGPQAAETRLILDRLGPIPLIGFFANGEISRQQLYGHTGVLTLFY